MTLPPKERAPADPPLDAPPETPPEDDEAEAGFELALRRGRRRAEHAARGAAAIKDYWRQAPVGPGVYRMIAADGEVLYVGKAHSIKKRIASYMRPEMQSARIAKMVARTASMVFVSTQTEASRRCCSKPTDQAERSCATTCRCATTRAFPMFW